MRSASTTRHPIPEPGSGTGGRGSRAVARRAPAAPSLCAPSGVQLRMADAQEGDFVAKLNALADTISEKNSCDVLLFSGYLNRFDEDTVIARCDSRPLRDRVMLLLTTYGGSPDAAYRVARTL